MPNERINRDQTQTFTLKTKCCDWEIQAQAAKICAVTQVDPNRKQTLTEEEFGNILKKHQCSKHDEETNMVIYL